MAEICICPSCQKRKLAQRLRKMTARENVRNSARGMDIDHILFFTAVAYAVLLLLRVRGRDAGSLPFRAVLVLLVALIAWLIARPHAGFIAALAWLALVLLPLLWRRRRESHGDPSRRPFPMSASFTPAVTTLLIINVAVFGLEFLRGGVQNPLTLHQLGELDTDSVRYAHEYWRMFSALFLHYGLLHLVFNLMALFVLGPPLEEEIGVISFFVVYLVSGLGSSATVVALTLFRITGPMQVVGASGCVMGVVGAWAGLLLRHRHAPLAQQRLRNILTIVGLQFVFDLTTPQISLAAHLGGLITGFLLGLALPARRPLQ